MGFSGQDYLSALPFSPPGALPDPGVKSTSPGFLHYRWILYCWVTGEASLIIVPMKTVSPASLQNVPREVIHISILWTEHDFSSHVLAFEPIGFGLPFLCSTCCLRCLRYSSGFPRGSEVKNPPAMQEGLEIWVQFLGWKNPLEEEMATHSSILAWEIPRTEEPGGLQSMGSQRIWHDLAHTHMQILTPMWLLP